MTGVGARNLGHGVVVKARVAPEDVADDSFVAADVHLQAAELSEGAEGIVIGTEGDAFVREKLPARGLHKHARDDVELDVAGEVRLEVFLPNDFVPGLSLHDLAGKEA